MLTRPVFVALALIAASAALARDPSIPQKGLDSDPRLPAPTDQTSGKVRPDTGASGGPTLSEKLEMSDGVIKPPSEFDPEIKTIPPDPSLNSMPIIKPPGNAK